MNASPFRPAWRPVRGHPSASANAGATVSLHLWLVPRPSRGECIQGSGWCESGDKFNNCTVHLSNSEHRSWCEVAGSGYVFVVVDCTASDMSTPESANHVIRSVPPGHEVWIAVHHDLAGHVPNAHFGSGSGAVASALRLRSTRLLLLRDVVREF